MFNIKTEKDLSIFLRIVAEEAVKETKILLEEKGISDPFVDNFQEKLNQDGLLEQEDEEEPDASKDDSSEKDKESKEDSQEQEGEEEEQPKTNPAKEKALSLGGYDEDTGASFDSVMTAINTMRAGRSLRDKEIKTELNDYYDRLDENEREVLLLFLKELSKILTGALDGDEAQDPSDPSTYFNITKRDKEEEQPGDEKNKVISKGQEREAERQDPVDQEKSLSDEEDTSPPIKVNESQDLTLLRKKVRLLMRS